MKRRWWIFSGTVLVVALLSLCLFDVRLRLAPRWVLSRALGEALVKLDSRFEDSPMHLLMPVLDSEGLQEADLQLETQLEHLGVVRYDMSVQTQLDPKRILATGTVVTGGKALDLELYLDQNFAAVSSRGLLGGNYYGITYESFSRDLRSRELLAALIGEKTLHQWEASVSRLDKTMDFDITLPEFTSEDIKTALYGVLALKPHVSREHAPAGASEYSHTVTFRATGSEIAEAAEPYRHKLTSELNALLEAWTQDPMTVIETRFFLYKGTLVKIQVDVESSVGAVCMVAHLGLNPETEPLSIEMVATEGKENSGTSLIIETASDKTAYREKISLVFTDNGVQNVISADYVYNLSNGEMTLKLLKGEKEANLRLQLEREGERLTIRIQDAAPILNLFRENPKDKPIIIALSLSPGSFVSVPEYRNLAQWSAEDLLELLAGLGGLLGLKIP